MSHKHSSGTFWEEKVGYSRGVRVGQIIGVSGTTALNQGVLQGKDNPYRQTGRILDIIREALDAFGGSMLDLARTRIYVPDVANWREIGIAHTS